MKYKTYNEAVLADRLTRQREREFYLECGKDTIKYYEKPKEDQKNLEVHGETIEDFCSGLEDAIWCGSVHFAYFDGESLFVKYQKDYTFYKDKFILTESAKSNQRLMKFLKLLPTIQPNYEALLSEEKYTKSLVDTYHYNEALSFKDQESLDEFKKFYHSKISLLAAKQYEKYKNIVKKSNSFLVNLIFLLLVGLLGLNSMPGYENLSLGIKVTTEIGLLFAKEMVTIAFFKVVANLKVRQKVGKAIKDNQEILDALSLSKQRQKEEQETLIDEVSLSQDKIIADIKRDMERVNAAQYEGYQKHLNILYKLAQVYLKAQKQNKGGTPLNLFCENESILTDLVSIEAEIDRCINEQSLDNTSEAILAQLALLSGQNVEDVEEVNLLDDEQDNTYLSGGNLTLKL